MKHYLFLVLLGLSLSAFAQNSAVRTKHFNLEKGLAIQGYDPVAYFVSNSAQKGSSKFQTTYYGVTYHFVSQANKDTFLKNPSKYEPEYGGYCAFAIGDYDKKVEINPKTFKITDGKLYLFYNAYGTNTLKSWNKDEKKLKTNGDINWANQIKH